MSPTDHTETDTDATETRTATATDDFTVTPYAVEGEIDYEKLIDRFGADRLTDEQVARFPDHPLLRRRTFYAGRDVDSYLEAAEADAPHAIVTGRGPSGPMHLGHVLPLYLAKRLQQETGATVYIPLSDDEKFLAKAQSFAEIGHHTRENLRDILAVGFDPDRTRLIIDTVDADVIYPLAVRLATYLTPATVEAVYGEQDTVGLQFYSAVQATHLLLPQLVGGRQPTLVPIAVDQDPHVRVCRDIAAKEALPVEKPGALLGRFLPSLEGPGKMSSSADAPSIELAAAPETVAETIRTHAYTGGRATIEEHRERGGDPSVDVPFQYLRFFFEPDDAELERIAADYRSGDLLSGELKEIAIDRITTFASCPLHQSRHG
ncbi:MAG: tryptophan--tRNA ligase [Natrinema limicola]